MLEQLFHSFMNVFLTLPTPKSFLLFLFILHFIFFNHDYSLMSVTHSFFLCCIIWKVSYHAFKRAMRFPVIVVIWMKCNWTFFSFQLLICFMFIIRQFVRWLSSLVPLINLFFCSILHGRSVAGTPDLIFHGIRFD